MKYCDTNLTTPTYTTTYDASARPISLTDNNPVSPVTWVNNVQYGLSSELLQMSYGIAAGYSSGNCPPDCGNLQTNGGYYTETRQYNVRTQLTNLSVGGLSVEYRYSP